MGLLARFVGMVTDSRSFLSYSRHEYFRRLLCNLLGEDVRRGCLPDDRDLLARLVRNVWFFNAPRLLRVPARPSRGTTVGVPGGLTMTHRQLFRAVPVAVLAMILGLAGPGASQQITGAIEGIVTDSSGAVLPGATVELTNTATGITRRRSPRRGTLRVQRRQARALQRQGLPRRFQGRQSNLDVEVNRTVKVDAALEVGQPQRDVVVTAASTVVDVTKRRCRPTWTPRWSPSCRT